MGCTTAGPLYVTFGSGGPKYEAYEIVVSAFIDIEDEESVYTVPDLRGDEWVSLSYRDSLAVIRLMYDAETTGRDFGMSTYDNSNKLVAGAFSVTGFTANYWRLPCAE